MTKLPQNAKRKKQKTNKQTKKNKKEKTTYGLLLYLFFDGGQQSVLMRNLKTVLLNQCHHPQGTFWPFVGVVLLPQW